MEKFTDAPNVEIVFDRGLAIVGNSYTTEIRFTLEDSYESLIDFLTVMFSKPNGDTEFYYHFVK